MLVTAHEGRTTLVQIHRWRHSYCLSKLWVSLSQKLV